MSDRVTSLRRRVRGIVRRAYLVVRRVTTTLLIERSRGIETAGYADLSDLGLEGRDRVGYEPSGWLDLRRILRHRDVDPDDVFIDLGSGKGRVLLAAARYPFRRIIGVELSEELNAVARRNVEAAQRNRPGPPIEVVTSDVLDYEIPDDVTVAYSANAFGGEVFEAVIDKLVASVDRNPRPLRFIYRIPLEEARLARSGRFRLVRVARGLRPGRTWSRKMSIRMYVVEPRAGSGYATGEPTVP